MHNDILCYILYFFHVSRSDVLDIFKGPNGPMYADEGTRLLLPRDCSHTAHVKQSRRLELDEWVYHTCQVNPVHNLCLRVKPCN